MDESMRRRVDRAVRLQQAQQPPKGNARRTSPPPFGPPGDGPSGQNTKNGRGRVITANDSA